jgi:membrane associated rhomboid family serine protease
MPELSVVDAGFFRMFRNLTPVVRTLLYANFIVFALQWLTGFGPVLESLFALWPIGAHYQSGEALFEPWQIVTYAFLHANFMHIFFNMFALFMFGPDVERVLGSRRFTLYYFTCVVGAALAQLAVTQWLHPASGATVGASGGLFGVMLLFAMAFPRRKMIFVLLPIPIDAWLFVALYAAAELAQGVFGTTQGVAHFAHLGGMAAGYALILYWRGAAHLRNSQVK